jgi:hypothetical protein
LKKRKISKNQKITQNTFTFRPHGPRKKKMKSNIWGVKTSAATENQKRKRNILSFSGKRFGMI